MKLSEFQIGIIIWLLAAVVCGAFHLSFILGMTAFYFAIVGCFLVRELELVRIKKKRGTPPLQMRIVSSPNGGLLLFPQSSLVNHKS